MSESANSGLEAFLVDLCCAVVLGVRERLGASKPQAPPAELESAKAVRRRMRVRLSELDKAKMRMAVMRALSQRGPLPSRKLREEPECSKASDNQLYYVLREMRVQGLVETSGERLNARWSISKPKPAETSPLKTARVLVQGPMVW